MKSSILPKNDKLSSKSYFEGDKRIDVVEGTISVDTRTWGTTMFLPPFKELPEISLMRKTGNAISPEISSVTLDTFSVTINSSVQAGEWIWRARGELLKPIGISENIETLNKRTGNPSKPTGRTIIRWIFVICFLVVVFVAIISNIKNDNWQNNIILYIVVMVIVGIIHRILTK